MGLEHDSKATSGHLVPRTPTSQLPVQAESSTSASSPNFYLDEDQIQDHNDNSLNHPPPTLPISNSYGRGPGLPNLDYSQYCPPNFKANTSWLQLDDGSIITNHELYCRSPEALKKLIRTQGSLPPKPIIKIQGTRAGLVDFDLKLNLMPYIIRPDGSGWNYLEILPPEESSSPSFARKKKGREGPSDDLDDLAKRFCRDQVGSRQLVITRQTTNHDTKHLEGRIRSLISRLNYPGTVTISFPLLHSKVTIQPPQKALAVLSNLFRTAKKYEVKAVWPYANCSVEQLQARAGGSGGVGGMGEDGVSSNVNGRNFAVASEDDWWRDWKDAIRGAVVAKRRGWVTSEDRLEALMSTRRNEGGGQVVWSDRVEG